ncbi:sugar transferase [Thalassotalea piscium]|uniref:Lipopolysaccharide/colanic/teichoic acid biosynthesis glycosyltransferase n=1 Tax=Thalassotalea piscium TaxID=1230533 RepID=A0A7X0NJF6_9GAMM|nr:sugar transferase [Thalassotalea piscium]MBB6544431.1 lipopolysaccharide/colanic/teichoic acid biosynthesis glycosyltransferase [Thalassotalea piscium]
MIKRLFDFTCALILLFLLAPVMIVTAIILFASHCRPVIYTQPRPGKDDQIFNMIKFRSMTDEKNTAGELLPDSERLTSFGKFIRKTSIDELPGLWNVLVGHMSLVGPRPLLIEYLPLYSAEQAQRHKVKPGITGWAQVNGRNAISWNEKFKLDVWYVNNQSFWLDIKILLLTVKKVFAQADINAAGQATMTKFTGKQDD